MLPTASQLVPSMTSTPVLQTKNNDLTEIFGSVIESAKPAAQLAKPANDLDLLFSSASSRDGNHSSPLTVSQNL
jgi:hypothetical protein